jgi:hypothetical protein
MEENNSQLSAQFSKGLFTKLDTVKLSLGENV